MTTTKKSTESVETLEQEIEQKKNKVRQMKRADSEIRLVLAVKDMNNEDRKAQKEILDACYDYIAQHRALWRKGGFNQSGEYIEC